MNLKTKRSVLTGIHLAVTAALSMGAQAKTASTAPDIQSPRTGDVLQANTGEFEVSFLSVPTTCKSSHAAFDAVTVGIENISTQVLSIHAEVERA